MNIHAPLTKFNDWLGLHITSAVGTMWCAYIFAAISLTSLPSTLHENSINADVQWVAQTFLQLVLLSVIIVGQNIQGRKTEAQASETHDAVMDLHAKQDTLQASHDELHRKIDGNE